MKRPTEDTSREPRGKASGKWKSSDAAAMRTLELVFFVHLRQAECADTILAEHGLGRPHHRVMYFMSRKPGISVGELMRVLRVSNQALSRTTRELAARGLLEQRHGLDDRRVRCNHLTDKGARLLAVLVGRQIAMVREAHDLLTEQQVDGLWEGLEVMVRPDDVDWLTPHPGSRVVKETHGV